MLKRKDQNLLSEAYGQVGSRELSAPNLMGGKPVMITMDMPGAEIDTDCEDLETGSNSMVISDLHKIAKRAIKIHDAIRQGKELEAWEISKITKAAVNISDVYDSLEFEECDDENDMYNRGYEDSHACKYADKGCTCGGCSDCQ